MDQRVEWRMLGRLKVRVDGQEIALGSQRQQRLALALALAGPGGLTSDELASRTWDDDLPANPAAVIRTYVSRLRQALGDDDARLLVTTGQGYAFAAGVESDLARFHQLIGEADRADDAQAAKRLLEDALSLFIGRPLAGFEDIDWVEPLISRISDDRLDAVESLVEAMIENHEFVSAAKLAEEELLEHPYQEGLRSLQMLALYGANRQADALRVYEEHRETMIEDLGVDPSVELQELNQRILEQDPTLEVATTPLTVWRRHRTVLVGLIGVVVLVVGVALFAVLNQRGKIDDANRVARSQEIMATAAGLAVSDPELALLLAVEAQRLAPDVDAPSEVIDALAASGVDARSIATFDQSVHGFTRVRYADVTSDGELVLVGDHDSFAVIETSTGTPRWIKETGGEHFFRWGYFAGDEDTLMILRYDSRSVLVEFGAYQGTAMDPGLTAQPGRVELYDTNTGELVREYLISESCAANELASFRSIDLARGLLVYSDFDGGPCDEFGGYSVVVIDTEIEEELYRVFAPEPSAYFDATLGGGRVLWFDPARAAHVVFDLDSGEEFLIEEREGRAVLSPDGKTLAIVPGDDGGPTGSPLLFDVESGALIDRLTGVSSRIITIHWTADSSRIFTLGLGTLASWDIATGEQTLNIVDPQGVIGNGGVSENGDFTAAYLADTDLLRVWNTGLAPTTVGVTTTTVEIGTPIRAIDGTPQGVFVVTSQGSAQSTIGTISQDGLAEIAPGFAVASLDASSLVWQSSDQGGRGPVVVADTTGDIKTTFEGICWSDHHESRPPTCRPGQEGIPGEVFDLAASTEGSHVAGTVTTATPDLIATTRLMVWAVDGSLIQDAIIDGPPTTRVAWIDDQTVILETGNRFNIAEGEGGTTGLSPTAVAGDGTGASYVGTSDGAIWMVSAGEAHLFAESVHDGLIDSIDVLGNRVGSFGNDGILAITDTTSGIVLRRIPVGSTGGSLTWVDEGTIAIAQDDHVTYFSVEPIDVATLAGELITRTMTDTECVTYLDATCADWDRALTSS